MSDQPPAARFPTTHWSRIVATGDPDAPLAREALAELCQAYWFPLYAYIRRRGHDPDRAMDLTQDLFVRLLEKGVLAEADRARGRFRAFLRAVCADFLANSRDRENALKRGGGRPDLPIDSGDAEGRYAVEPAHELTPERIFDRTWALVLLGRVLERIREEYRLAGQSLIFEVLSPVLTDGSRAVAYATLAAQLSMTEGAVRVAVHRLRRRYGERLREEIAVTVDEPAEVDDEIRDLFAALDQSS
jgi:DNA-directed RNA polymerase specialized sigma24 family protein